MKTKMLSFVIMTIVCIGSIYGQKTIMLKENVQQEMAMKKTEQLRKELSLNEEQRLEVYSIYYKYAQRHKPSTDYSADRTSIEKIFSNNSTEINREINNILTARQKNKFDRY